MKFLAALLLTLLFIGLLAVLYVGHVWYLPVAVVFYSALQDAIAAAAVTAAVVMLLRRRLGFNGFETALLVTVWLLGGYAFAISIPTVLDRSLSFYLLEKLQQRGGGILADRFETVFVEEYVPEFRLIDVRLTEQLQSGTIRMDGGCIRLTERGAALAEFSRFFRLNLLAKHRLLAGKYTDALVDPFQRSATGKIGYEC
ncbi:MAG: hypothetical protein Q8Q62_04615 [Mesorhizobium sp.]|nr:hypothetical protein [Mesorhizobium sp.]